MDLAPGDIDFLWALFTYRYLTSGQLTRRCRRSTQIVRRAIRRRLKPGDFVVTLQRQPAEEAAYTLGKEGLAFIASELKCPVSDLPFPRTSTSRGFFWNHSMLITEVRLAFDLATKDAASAVVLEKTIPEWAVNPAARRSTPSHERFVLTERLKDSEGLTHWYRPDCLFLVRPKVGRAEQLVAAFLEADRNTEAVRSRIRAKYEAFYLYWQRRLYIERFEAVAMRVLFVLDDVTDRQRIHSMQEDLRAFTAPKKDGSAFQHCFRFALKRDLNERPSSHVPSGTPQVTSPGIFPRACSPGVQRVGRSGEGDLIRPPHRLRLRIFRFRIYILTPWFMTTKATATYRVQLREWYVFDLYVTATSAADAMEKAEAFYIFTRKPATKYLEEGLTATLQENSVRYVRQASGQSVGLDPSPNSRSRQRARRCGRSVTPLYRVYAATSVAVLEPDQGS